VLAAAFVLYSAGMNLSFHPYRPRSLDAHGVESRDGWRIKRYAIRFDPGSDLNRLVPGIEMAWAALPRPAAAPGRPAVGFLIAHQGRGADYVVLGWWDRENELPLRVFVRPAGEPAFRAAQASESVCVWDLQVIGFERDAYTATVLSERGSDIEGYLRRFRTGPA